MIPVDSIVIPERFVSLAADWHGGLNCMLYAVCSTGGLTVGNRRPRGCDSREEWYYSIWCDLSVDVMYAKRAAKRACNEYDPDYGCGDLDEKAIRDAYEGLVEFEDWVDEQCGRLCESYGIEHLSG